MLNYFFLLNFIFIGFVYPMDTYSQPNNPLEGKIICIDPGHGGTAKTDSYRVGSTGEREEWINLRVGLRLKKLLEDRGAKVIMTRKGDEDIPLSERAELAVNNKADLFLSIHHNATADPEVNFPIIYFHGNASENMASVDLGKEIARKLSENLYSGNTKTSLVSDHTIFPRGGAVVLRSTYGIPAVLSEASFFTNLTEEEKLKESEYNQKEAEGYLEALENFFANSIPPIMEKNSRVEKLSTFRVFQEAERMNEIARFWYEDFLEGKKFRLCEDIGSKEKAYELFTRSARSFPDSYVAADCHRYRAILLKELGRHEESREAERRVKEYYVNMKND